MRGNMIYLAETGKGLIQSMELYEVSDDEAGEGIFKNAKAGDCGLLYRLSDGTKMFLSSGSGNREMLSGEIRKLDGESLDEVCNRDA